MRIPIYQIDAFTSEVFRGNPAAVCPLESWPADAVMQAIAMENNLAETAFLLGRDGDYDLRWFTPAVEVDLCGHATLASAWVVFHHIEPEAEAVRFGTRSGVLTVMREGDWLSMDFPALRPESVVAPPEIAAGLGREPIEVLASSDYLAVFAAEDDVRSLRPDMSVLSRLDRRGVIATAPGRECDFVSRFFAPNFGIPEDPVTGSAHCILAPYWSKRLGKHSLRAIQVSARGGEVLCEDEGERVRLKGQATPYLEGWIQVDARQPTVTSARSGHLSSDPG